MTEAPPPPSASDTSTPMISTQPPTICSRGIELGNADAMYAVAVIFLAGADGDEDAIMSGISYLTKAAQLGHADAEEVLLGILDEINGNQ